MEFIPLTIEFKISTVMIKSVFLFLFFELYHLSLLFQLTNIDNCKKENKECRNAISPDYLCKMKETAN